MKKLGILLVFPIPDCPSVWALTLKEVCTYLPTSICKVTIDFCFLNYVYLTCNLSNINTKVEKSKSIINIPMPSKAFSSGRWL
jgi:hypothetical protein